MLVYIGCMSGVVIGVPGAVRVAQSYIDAGDLAEALVALRTALLGVTLEPREPDPDLADAARLYAGVLASLGEPHSATPFSAYAHQAAKVMDEPTSSRALQADLIHSFVLRVTGQMAEAVALYRDVVQRLGLRFGPEGRPALASQADLAVALHAAGECTEARQTLHRTYFTRSEEHTSAL